MYGGEDCNCNNNCNCNLDCLLICIVLVFVIRLSVCLNLIYQIKVVTPLESSDLHPVTAGVPQGAIWFPLLFNLYIHLLPTVVKHCLIMGYADDHTLLKIIQDKSDRFTAASQMNEDLQAISQFGKLGISNLLLLKHL